MSDLVEALRTVATRIDRLWEVQGEEYAAEVVSQSPDPDDPEVVRRQHVERLRFIQRLHSRLPEALDLLSLTRPASARRARLLEELDGP